MNNYLRYFWGFILCVFAILQYNDPDWYVWIPAYISVAVLYLIPEKININYAYIIGVIFFLWMCKYVPDFISWINNGLPSITGTMKAENPEVELIREFFGIIICLLSILGFIKFKQSKNILP